MKFQADKNMFAVEIIGNFRPLMAGKKDIRQMALDEPDFDPL
jgi:hypothetical protein